MGEEKREGEKGDWREGEGWRRGGKKGKRRLKIEITIFGH